MASGDKKRMTGKRIGCLYKKHLEKRGRMEVCTKPSA